MAELCRICQTRRPRRYCPGVQGEICSLCCGTEREVSIQCPLDCPFLQEARLHEKPVGELDRENLPNQDIRVPESFVREHEELFVFCVATLVDGTLRTSGAVDADILAALEALIQTYRTTESGLIYQTRPDNRVAGAIQDVFEKSVSDFEKERHEQALSAYRPAEILACLVFTQRAALIGVNGRPRGRAFIDAMRLKLNIPLPQVRSTLLVS
jgi:hypothetical protein